MLVLSRTVGEKIVIDKNITITIVRIKDKTVRIGIDAPPSVPVVRLEVLGTFEHKSRSKS